MLKEEDFEASFGSCLHTRVDIMDDELCVMELGFNL